MSRRTCEMSPKIGTLPRANHLAVAGLDTGAAALPKDDLPTASPRLPQRFLAPPAENERAGLRLGFRSGILAAAAAAEG